MKMFRSVRSLMLLGAAAALTLLMGIAQYRAYDRRQDDIGAAYARLQIQVDSIAARYADILRNTHTLFIALLTDLDVSTFDTGASCRNALSELLAREPVLDNIGLTPPDGRTVCNGRNTPVVDLSGFPFFQQALNSGETVVGAPLLATGTGNLVLPFARAIRDERGNPEGVLVASISFANLLDEFSRSELLQGARMGMVDSAGTVLAHYPDPARMVGQDISAEPFFRTIIDSEGRGTGEEPGLDGEPRLFAFAQLPETELTPVYFWVSFYKNVITAESNRVFIQSLVINLIIAALLFLLFWLTWESLVMRPLTAIMNAARRLSAGDYQARTNIRQSANEFGTLAGHFDRMADSLSSKAEILQLNRALKVLSGCAENVVRAHDEQELLDGVCRTIVETGSYIYAWVGFPEDDDYGTVRITARYGGILDDVIEDSMPSWKKGQGPGSTAVRTGQRQVLQDLGNAGPRDNWRPVAVERGALSAVALPFLDQGKVIGVLAIFGGKSHVFTEAELSLLDELAEDITYGILTRRTALERERAEALAEHLAKVDPVTQLPNRIELIAHLQKYIERAHSKDEPLAVLSVAINRLNEVQDVIGIAGVDDVLHQFAVRLSGHMAGIHFVARNSSASIAIVAPLAIEEPESVANVVRALTEEPFEYAGIPIGLLTTVGVALFPEHGDNPDSLLRHADIAVRRAREAGNDYGVYSGTSESENPQNLILLSDLRKGIRDGELVLFYQPKVSTVSNTVVGVEALVRWQHPERGMVPPFQFIPLAENTGLIKPLTYWVLGEAMRQIARWQPAGIGTRIAVNVSQYNLHDQDFYEQLLDLPSESGTRLEQLDIELTESALMEDPAHARELLKRLGNLGMRVYIDDFGTGYSSLAYLATLPIHALKIDRSFVIQMHEPRYYTIVKSTISMAHSLGIKVVAEGVETEELVQSLAELGCDEIQGYIYSKPLPSEELDKWCEEFSGPSEGKRGTGEKGGQ